MAHFAGASTLNFGGATPTGNFVPEIYSQKVLNFFRRKSVVEGITNNDYYGEISQYGDSVQIIKEPTISVSPLLAGDTLVSQPLADNKTTLVLDKANYFQFEEDDLQKAITHIGWQSLATDSAAYSLKQAYDQEILGYMADNVDAANKINDTAYANLRDLSTPDALLNEMSRLATILTKGDVPEENRFLIMNPEGWEVLLKADSKLINADFNGGMADLRNGLATTAKLRGFNIYVTNNAPTFETTGTVETHNTLLAGHMSSTAAVSAILDTEVIRSETKFADKVRGKHVYGRTVIRPEAMAISYATFGA